MSALLLLCVALAGGVGAAMRYAADLLVHRRASRRLPIGTSLVNLTGSLVLGLVTGLAQAGHLGGETVAIVGTGLLGGYTTFSTASVETVRLAQQRRPIAALGNAFGNLAACVLAAAAGIAIGSIA